MAHTSREDQMPRQARSDVESLLLEVRALELLAEEADVPPSHTQEYWAVAAELISLATDVEEFQRLHPAAGYDEPEMLMFRRRIREIGARLSELALEE
jgi:hypothetical protein